MGFEGNETRRARRHGQPEAILRVSAGRYHLDVNVDVFVKRGNGAGRFKKAAARKPSAKNKGSRKEYEREHEQSPRPTVQVVLKISNKK